MKRWKTSSATITLAPKKLILTRRASEGSASEPSLARRVSICRDAKLSCRGNNEPRDACSFFVLIRNSLGMGQYYHRARRENRKPALNPRSRPNRSVLSDSVRLQVRILRLFDQTTPNIAKELYRFSFRSKGRDESVNDLVPHARQSF